MTRYEEMFEATKAAQFPYGALTKIEDAPRVGKVYIGPSRVMSVAIPFVSVHDLTVGIEKRPNHTAYTNPQPATYYKYGEQELWSFDALPMKIPFHDKDTGFIFTNYWLAYAHLLRVLERRRNGNL